MWDVALDFDDDVFFYQYSSESKSNHQEQNTVNLWEVYRIHEDMDLSVQLWGKWSLEREQFTEVPTFKWIRRRNLQGVKLKSLVIRSAPYTIDIIDHGDGTKTFTGLNADIAYALQVLFF